MTRPLVPIIGLVALVICLVGALYDWTAFLRSWLVASLTWGALPLGAAAVLMTFAMTGGAWGQASQGVWRALTFTMPLFALAMLPVLFGVDELFSWTRPPSELPEVVRRKLLYLNEPFLLVRWIVYFVVWLGLAWLLAFKSRLARSIAAPGLILWVFTLTFFSTDWYMSLEPEFYSDVFGLERICAMAASGMALGLWILAPRVTPAVRKDIANIWLAVLLSWAFMGFSQLIVIWSGNIPDEIIWYIHRAEGNWQWIGRMSFVLFLLIPFAILLSTSAKQSPGWLRIATGICLVGYVLQTQWMVLPAFEEWRATQSWLVPAALVAIGGGFVWVIGRSLEHQEARNE
ncbi:hypothetical protein [Modicisalibacter xianhensis]|uniref:Quinol:cytochrome c oxidoreductase quinone-binding subunit 2 n=1 Tax=Modicisalibacter xianhensis TaxID=442341 RepID=A0A1I3CVE7_9GAMM|nr:hypothetical protein [Halomonas xianhensis]SFH78211.1 hypothetical protein SAMN04487959_109102 [Halomonas xianhensis]